jgi:hypothetical protein
MIHERAMLCDLTMTSFTGIKTSKRDTDDLLETKNARRGSASVVVKLIPKEALGPVASVTTKIRSVHKMLTAPWSDTADILPTSLFMEHTTIINDGFAERDQAVSEFLRIYPQLEGPARQALGDLDFDRLWTPVDLVRQAFTHKIRHWPVPQGVDFRCDLDEQDLARVREQADMDAREMWRGAMSNIQNRIIVVMQGMIEKLEAYKETVSADGNTSVTGAFRDSIFDAANNLAQIMPHFNINNDPAMARAISEITSVVNLHTPEELRLRASARNTVVTRAKNLIDSLA